MGRFVFLCGILSVAVRGIIIKPGVKDSVYVTDVKTAPFFVALGERGDCAGTLVTISALQDKGAIAHVVTAAHCFCRNDKKTRRSMPVIFFDGSRVHVKHDKVLFNPHCMFSCDEDGPNRYGHHRKTGGLVVY